MQPLADFKQQNGAALIVGLVLMVLITALAISGMNTATSKLAMARNDQIHEYVFQAAETGLEDILSSDSLSTSDTTRFEHSINAQDSVSGEVIFEGWSIVPDKAYSLGTGSGIAAYHFIGTATASSLRDPGASTSRDAQAVHSQAFYVVGPEPPAL